MLFINQDGRLFAAKPGPAVDHDGRQRTPRSNERPGCKATHPSRLSQGGLTKSSTCFGRIKLCKHSLSICGGLVSSAGANPCIYQGDVQGKCKASLGRNYHSLLLLLHNFQKSPPFTKVWWALMLTIIVGGTMEEGKLTQVFATLRLLLTGAAGGALAGFSSAGAAATWDEETGKGGGRSSSLISL